MKIGIDIRLIGKKQTGSESVFLNLTKSLVEIDRKNKYLLFTDIVDDAFLVKIKKDLNLENNPNFEIVSLKTRNKFSWNFWTLPRYLYTNPVDIYLTQYITPFFVSRKIKIITIIHDISFCVFPRLIRFSDLFFLRLLIPMAIKRADKIIGVSRFTRDELMRYYRIKSEKVEYIYNAVSDSYLAQTYTRQTLEIIRKKYKLPEKFILYIGTLQPRKNIPVLVRAYAMIKDEFPEIKLVLAGGKGHNYDKNIDQEIKKFLLKKTEVFFPGFILENDKKAVMSLASCFCSPSLYEGFGIPILEAFSCKLPCVISMIPPHIEVAKNSALFFAPTNVLDLVEKLRRVFTEKEFSKALVDSESSQLSVFSWQKTTKKILRIFQETLD